MRSHTRFEPDQSRLHGADPTVAQEPGAARLGGEGQMQMTAQSLSSGRNQPTPFSLSSTKPLCLLIEWEAGRGGRVSEVVS